MPQITKQTKTLGRPRAGTEAERMEALLDKALSIFMQQGYSVTSIGKIASAAGVSTRTIYEHYANKAELMVAALSRKVEQDVEQMQGIDGLSDMPPEQALSALAQLMLSRVTSPELIAFYRMMIAEAARFPETMIQKMRISGPLRIQSVIARYLQQQSEKNNWFLHDADKAAATFCHMLISEPRHHALLGVLEKNWDAQSHIEFVVRLFLHGVVPNKEKRS